MSDAPSVPGSANHSAGEAAEPRATTSSETASLDPHSELAQAQQQRDELKDQLQRSRAEFVNYQKRAKAQAEADRIYSVSSLARDILEALDNLDRATEALRATAPTGISEGLSMVHKNLLAALAKHGVEPIEALGQPFDPNQHDALVQQPDSEHPEGTVVVELSKGFRLHDRVLRPSKVAVSVKPSGV
ncbi:MAG: nucleotide exchange factor GrpE [Isosphaeraceae bacterium]